MAGTLLPAAAFAAQDALPESAAIPEPHFPSRLYQFVWRNWELANADRMAEVVHASPREILELGESMGLPPKPQLSEDQLRRIYVTAIRQNWHLLPERQIVQLLGWTVERLRFTLKEDDFLDVKLGRNKPRCDDLRYSAPTQAEKLAASRIRETVRTMFGASFRTPGERLCQFVGELSDPRFHLLRDRNSVLSPGEIDLSTGWSITLPTDGPLRFAAQRFDEYLRDAMGARLEVSRPDSARKKSIRFDTHASGHARESFEVRVSPDEIVISSGDDAGAIQGIYWLQDRMEERDAPFLPTGSTSRRSAWNPRYLYSYFALYGDPLMEPEADPFPDAYLEKLARCGINGVWMQAVLNTLAPSRQFPEFGEGSETRLRNLDALVKRAARFGVRVYLYLNEPRAMPDAFFKSHPGIRGSSSRGLYAMCTSTPEVRDWIRESLTHVVRRVPDIGGFFAITMSENHTNCFSHGGGWGQKAPHAGDCPRCTRRTGWEVIGELFETFRAGVREGGSSANVIAYDWAWGDDLSSRLIPALPRDTGVLSISEWDLPVVRGGVSQKVGEYSISSVGPGPRALRNWDRARESGNPRLAKTQFNNTWEMSAVPFIPAMQLITRHCERLAKAGIDGVMASWTCGGYPSPNLAAAKEFYFEPRKPTDEILRATAARRYGRKAAPEAVEAWHQFSVAFEEFPYGVSIYIIPVQHGPANLLRLAPTGHNPGMILFPHDRYKNWCGTYPPEVVRSQFQKMAEIWNRGLELFRKAMAKASPAKKVAAAADVAVAETCYHHFRSVANQVEFYMLRDKLASASGSERAATIARMKAIAADEIELARRQFPVARSNSTIAFEASNHYYYTPLDLVEKVLNCRDVIAQLDRLSS